MKRCSIWCLTFLLVLTCTSIAAAQGFGQRPGQQPGMGGPDSKAKDTPAGPAEAAPDAKESPLDLPPLPPWPGEASKKLQIFQLNGYFRFRWDYLHNFNLSQLNEGGYIAPFYRPLSDDPASIYDCEGNRKQYDANNNLMLNSNCRSTSLGGGNLRLRLEPTLNVSEQVRVYTQMDVLDNLQMGSTPQGLAGESRSVDAPIPALTDSQAPAVAGKNTNTPAIVVKRAWGDVGTPVGQLRFGRMPIHWGVGMMANDGSCWDCDYGDTADRIMFVANIAGYTASMGYDYATTGPNTLSLGESQGYYLGQSVDLEKLDDANEWFWVLGMIDSDDVIKDKIDRGIKVFNYGLYLKYRHQDLDYASGTGYGSTESALAGGLINRHLWTVTPDLWMKLVWKKFHLDLEAAVIGGHLENGANSNDNQVPYDILQIGAVAKMHFRLFRDTFRVGLESGFASGDQAEPTNMDINRKRFSPLGHNADGSLIDADGALREFRFDYDYHVDLILFREIMGTVANAFYFKPWMQYNITDSLGGRLDAIYSLAHQPLSYPGNSRNLGIELDVDLFYHNLDEGFSAGIQYGVLFPMAGLERTADVFGTQFAADAETAQTVQARLIIKF